MRERFDIQLPLGVIPIEKLRFTLHSRDELPPVLHALQWIFGTPRVRDEVLKLLAETLSQTAKGKAHTGRPGMHLWRILVLAVVRLALNLNYDRLEYMVNNDAGLRGIMGLPLLCAQEDQSFGQEEHPFSQKNISRNVCHLDDGVLEAINQIIVREGRDVFASGKSKAKEAKMEIKTDSFVVETDVHFPTDCNLLWDAARKCLDLVPAICQSLELGGWRKAKDWKRRLKALMRACAKSGEGNAKNKEERQRRAAQEYVHAARDLAKKVEADLVKLRDRIADPTGFQSLVQAEWFFKMLLKHVDLVERRLVLGQSIPHQEKIFSLFEEHTEWINKGKKRPAIELGHRVLISADQNQLVVDYKVLEGTTDGEEAQPLAERLSKGFGRENLGSISFDKGFSSASNQEELAKHFDEVILPKKGRLNEEERERESQKSFKSKRRAHSAVESAINSLEHHGLDRCPDKGLRGFKRYVALGVMAYNLHVIGNELSLRKASGREAKERQPQARAA